MSTYTAIGLTEYWSLSMELFDATVKSPVQRWSDYSDKVNEGTQSERRLALQEWALNSPETRKMFEGDLILYEHALSLFRAQTHNSLGTVWEE